MESGPEPQELFESVEHNHQHMEHSESTVDRRLVNRSAITASILAVLAALASLLSGHAVNEAIIKQSQASDQWAYYQAKSTKEHLYEGDGFVVSTLLKAEGHNNPNTMKSALADFKKLTDKYEKEKEHIQSQAETITKQSETRFAEHEDFSFAVACFQIAIVLASISMMMQRNWLYNSSVLSGIMGMVFTFIGLMH